MSRIAPPTRRLAGRRARNVAPAAAPERRGVALLIVIAMLALFATVGLAFVFYAEAEATASRYFRSTGTSEMSDIPAGNLMEFALAQLIFEPDPTKNPGSSLAGFSLARTMYGPTGGTVPFNGLGRPTSTTLSPGVAQFEGCNVPYTYPDINNAFLGVIDKSGVIQTRSFSRGGQSLRPTTLPNPAGPGDGDVRNVESSAGCANGLLNDSYWMDLGFPTMTSKNGTRYKPLFAFFVADLDSRLNLSVVGNYKADYSGTAGVFTSRLGLGVHEINPARMLAIDKTEIAKLFRGSANPRSRVGAGATDDADNGLTFPATRTYNRVDWSGTSGAIPAAPNVNLSNTPIYVSGANAWTDWTPGTPHALGFDYPNATNASSATSDLRLSVQNMQSVLCWRDKGASTLTGDLLRLLPKNLDPTNTTGTPLTGQQLLNLVTTISSSLDTAHLAPFLVGDGNAKYTMAATDAYPRLSVTTQNSKTPGAGEMSASLHSRTAAELRRINLNRGFASTADRQQMAQEIFNRMVAVTGATPPGPYAPFQPTAATDSQYRATRWLAQYAVNIVDFIDDDDTMTTFCWNVRSDPATQEAGDFVFGVERNRLVINECFAMFDNDIIADPPVNQQNNPVGSKYRLNVWAELYNPIGASAVNNGIATLAANGRPKYRLLLASDSTGITDSPTGLPTNLAYDNPSDPTQGVVNWTGQSVQPGEGSKSDNGYYTIAPPDDTILASRKPTFVIGTRGGSFDTVSTGMRSKLYDIPAGAMSVTTYAPTVVLQRLADQTMDEQPNPRQPNYNPFVTVDYFPDIAVNNNINYVNTTNLNPPTLKGFTAQGRFQPLEGTNIRTQVANAAYTTRPDTEPIHSFGTQNNPIRFGPRFSVLYHLDRQLTSAAELINAPAIAPSQVTRVFPKTFSSYAAYSDASSMIYRFLETVTVGSRAYNAQLAGSNPSGIAGAGLHQIVVPGKININLIQDKTLLYSLFDSQTNSWFKDTDVDAFYTDLLAVRPIAGFGDFSQAADGTVTTKKTLFENMFKRISDKIASTASTTSEYEQTEALRKVMNNMTFTSNAFAVWITVGFFTVDSSDRPTAELNATTGGATRHRAFAIVDRSQLVIPDQQLTTLGGAANASPTTATVDVAAVTGNLPAASGGTKAECPNWTIKPGIALTIDKGQATEETVMVMQVNNKTITVGGFRQNHAAGATVHFGGIRGPQCPAGAGYVMGNPGPQPNFNLRDYSYVVPYYTIID